MVTQVGDRQRQNAGTEPVREGQQFDAERLQAWMRAHVVGFRGPLHVEQFRGGQSNPTYKLVTPGRAYVLRRKPAGVLLPGAHAVDREYRVITALFQAGFPVAEPFALCLDDAVVGSAFYVMAHVDGRSFWDTSFPTASAQERSLLFEAMVQTLAQLHSFDVDRLGLSDFGRSGGYVARQLARWTRQYRETPEAGRDPFMDRLAEWLPEHIPPGEETALIHGDYRCDNLIFDVSSARVSAVLDWELSTLGHPVADFAFHAMIYRLPPDMLTGLAGLDLGRLNIPDEERYVAAYCARTGRGGLPDYDYFLAFNMFRLAAILHGVKGRVLRGTASSAHAREVATHVEPLARLAWLQLEGGLGR